MTSGRSCPDLDESYWQALRSADEQARNDLAGGRRQVFEARLKQRERTRGHDRHQAGPAPHTRSRGGLGAVRRTCPGRRIST